MLYPESDEVKALKHRLESFMDRCVYPNEERFYREAEELGPWKVYPVVEELKPKARAEGLWNLFLPESEHGAGLTNLEYAPLCEVMGRSHLAPELFNCSAPDTGNMEVLARYGTAAQQERWLKPLLAGEIRSCFAMTEPAVASSDATNIDSRIVRDGDHYVINGRKWYTTNATDPRCKICIFMGKTDPDSPDRHRQQSMILVPMDTPGVEVLRPLPVFGFYGVPDRASEVVFRDVRVPASNMLLGEGRGFEIAQGRLGPGRIHHCMRLIGLAERTLEKMCRRTASRVAFGKPVSEQTVTQERIAEARIMIEQARLLTLNAANAMDTVGNKVAKSEIAMIKVAVPNMACQVIDWAIQAHGGGGTSNDFGLAAAYATARLLRLADGPDEVHRNQIARLELRKYTN
ncbi:acyl-CoA dehydrogenase family protein [Bradyrhizobium septentrionale]|uniref:Acyl-CoA dehydrogenase family protein n=1 Tax=Bradyrhizobium septentrionale TaxID=1404411 RepID=A0A974A5U1_9BRAD|nr:acyl-CoA dehydrogenase family protein [Bradyrhizobium septentrionale]UGY17680.1 acyl-CoA dehydrogenase family protein [Bradyrhizobium septentrionale]UGY26417.1 acyl-CoA dehydrogenase family protein [Bradyrhizobium septentrionale]